jgi:hypothetical protein
MVMKKILLGLGLVVVLAAAIACSQDGTTTTPTVTENPGLSAVTDEAKNPVLICHHNPDLDDYLPEYHIIEVSSNGANAAAHCKHGDFTDGGPCTSCDLSYFGAFVGQNCCYCGGCTI